ncbi:MAG: histone deacetylase family protein [Rhodobacteraceae bacterium]|nr:histone deacetylase family protein [Paracoccaceae bacterium]
MTKTTILTHPDCLKHITPTGHPERVERLEAINSVLNQKEFTDLNRQEAELCTLEQLMLAHPLDYIKNIESRVPTTGFVSIDGDTHMSPKSWDAACRAVGANIQAVDMVLNDQSNNAFCAVRPPGHHAEKNRAMGFCLYGSVAIAALHALNHHGLARVAIIDFDVHHGNGTSNLLWDERRIFFASTHEMPLFPGTGHVSETGRHNQIVNKPLKSGSGSNEFKDAINQILDRMDQFAPELVLISAGFDAHYDDPLSTLQLTPEDFKWVTEAIVNLAETHCHGKIVSSLEGGYNLAGLTSSLIEHLNVLRGVT